MLRHLVLVLALCAPAAAEITIHGRVTGAGGTPLEGATARLEPLSTSFERTVRGLVGSEPTAEIATAVSDASGRFELQAPGPGVYEVTLAAEGRVARRLRLPPLVEATELDAVVLERDFPLRVRVVDAVTGTPIAGTRVGVLPGAGAPGFYGSWHSVERTATTGDDGTVVFPRGETEVVRVAAVAPGFVPGGQPRVAVLSEATLQLQAGAERSVRILDADGKGARARVSLGADRLAAAWSDDEGRLTVAVPPEGLPLFAETASGDWGGGRVEPPAEGETAPWTLRLQGLETQPGRLLDAATGKGVAGGWLAWRDHVARSAEDGRFVLQVRRITVPWMLHAAASGYAPEEQPFFPRPEVPSLEVTLHRARPVPDRAMGSGVGLVVDLDDRPVADAEVSLWRSAVSQRRFQDFEAAHQVRTAPDGRFVIERLRDGDYFLRVTAQGFAPYVVSGLEVVFDGENEADLGTVVLEPGVRLVGRVLGPGEEPIEGASVNYDSWASRGQLLPWETDANPFVKTDAEGTFVIPDRQPGEKLDLWAWHLGYAEGAAYGVECPTEDVEIVLEPTQAIRGHLVGPGGPVADGRVTASYTGRTGDLYSQSDQTDADGRFELEHLQAGRLEVRASAEGYAPLEQWVELAPGEVVEGLELRLAEGVSVEGRVLDPEGAGVRAWVSCFQEPRWDGIPRRTDGTGRFHVDGLAEGSLRIHAVAEGGLAADEEVTLGPGTNTVEIHLREEGLFEVSGRVVDGAGSPLPGAQVRLGGKTERSGEDGAFTLKDIMPGPAFLSAWKDGYATAERELVVDGPVFGFELTLSRGGSIAGRVLGLDAGLYANVQVTASRSLSRSPTVGWRSGKVDFEGRFRLTSLAPGEWTVEALEPGTSRRAQARAAVEDGGTVEVDLEFVRGLVLSGEVYLDGEPISGARVRARGLDVAADGRADTGYGGRFEILGLEAGRYQLDTETLRGSLLDRREIHLGSDRELRIDLVSGVLEGTVADLADGTALAEVRIYLEPMVGEPALTASLSTHSDSQGRFGFDRLPEGTYRLRAELAGYGFERREVAVRAGLREELELRMERTADLVLAVDVAAGRRPSRVVAITLDAAGEPLTAGSFPVTSEGEARLSGIPPGDWTLWVGAEGFGSVRLGVSVPGGSLPVVLPPETRLSVVVPELVSTGASATMTLFDGAGQPFLPAQTANLSRRFTLRSGRATIEGLGPGAWSVVVTASGERWTGQVTAPLQGGDVELVVE